MAKYILIEEQPPGSGCDYSIGCGIRVTDLRAKTMEEAVKEVIDIEDDWKEFVDELEHEDDFCDLFCTQFDSLNRVPSDKADYPESWQISDCYILEVSETKNMIEMLRNKRREIEDHIEKAKEKLAKDRRRQEFEKLKKEFG